MPCVNQEKGQKTRSTKSGELKKIKTSRGETKCEKGPMRDGRKHGTRFGEKPPTESGPERSPTARENLWRIGSPGILKNAYSFKKKNKC